MPLYNKLKIGLGKLSIRLWNRRVVFVPYIFYALLSLAILNFLLGKGYILTLDSPLSFGFDASGHFYGLNEWANSVFAISSAATPFCIFWETICKLIPPWILEKLALFLIFFLMGLGMHKLLPVKGTARYYSGLLYVVNPFTYTRFLAGQWGVLTAYAFFPFAIKAWLELLEQGSSKSAIKVAVLSTLVGLLQIQGFFLLFLAFLIILLVKLIKECKNFSVVARKCRFIFVSAGLFCGLNLYWLLPVLTTKNNIISKISQLDMYFFAPKASSAFGVVFDTASMYGFWRGSYIYAKDFIPFWWLLFILIFFVAVYGFIYYFRNKKIGWFVVSLAIMWFIGLVLALGAATNLTGPVFEWLWKNISFFSSLRDSQKFVALLCLVYAVLGGLGIRALIKIIRRYSNRLARVTFRILIVGALITPCIYSFTIFGFYGQLKTTDYPEQWYEVNEYLNQDKADFNVLFLPWHMYMNYSWLPDTDKNLANPAQQFFNKPVIAGDNIEIPGVYSESTNPISNYVEFLLSNGPKIDNLGELLAPLNVKYVILVNEADYQLYDYLYQQQDMKVVMEKPGITLFENEYSTARTYAVDSVVHIQSLNDYLKLSQTQDVMEHVYILGSGTDTGATEPLTPIKTVESSPVSYQLGGTSQNYTVFTFPQNVSTENWTYNGQKPVMTNLGFMPVFGSSIEGGNIIYTRFYHIYLPCYIVSFLILIGMIILFIKKLKERNSP
jgi:hypothetical protein